jgi:TonB family protein
MTPDAVYVAPSNPENTPLFRVFPDYPQMAREARIEGIVSFQAVIDNSGHVASLEPLSGHPLLIQAAIDAAKQWVYKPGRSNGEPVSTTIQLERPQRAIQRLNKEVLAPHHRLVHPELFM